MDKLLDPVGLLVLLAFVIALLMSWFLHGGALSFLVYFPVVLIGLLHLRDEARWSSDPYEDPR
jgi:hypothetical protein